MLGQWEVPERLRVRIRALDYDAATAHGNTWEVPKGLHVRMRARRIWTQLVHTTTMEGAQKAACAHVRARDLDVPEQPGTPATNCQAAQYDGFFCRRHRKTQIANAHSMAPILVGSMLVVANHEMRR